MKTINISKDLAERMGQTKKFALASKGCLWFWGEGDTVSDAKENGLDAIKKQLLPYELTAFDGDELREKTDEEILEYKNLRCEIREIV